MHFLDDSSVYYHTLFNSLGTLAWKSLPKKKKNLREIPRCMYPAPEYQKANSPCWLRLEKCEASLRFQWLDSLLCFFWSWSPMAPESLAPQNFHSLTVMWKKWREIVWQVRTTCPLDFCRSMLQKYSICSFPVTSTGCRGIQAGLSERKGVRALPWRRPAVPAVLGIQLPPLPPPPDPGIGGQAQRRPRGDSEEATWD